MKTCDDYYQVSGLYQTSSFNRYLRANLNFDGNGLVSKSEQPLNEVRVPQALPEYYIKYSQFENAKSDYLNRLSSKLSFEPSKPKGMSFYKIKEAF